MTTTNPFLDDFDELKSFYGGLSDTEIERVKEVIVNLLNKKPTFKNPVNENYHYLLDFSDFDNNDCQFLLFQEVCQKLTSNLYWFVFGDDNNPLLFDEFVPPMIAKTPCTSDILAKVSSSFMQMQNGAFVVFDESKNFYAIIVDGYYMVCLLNKSVMIDNLQNYLNNWQNIDKNLDEMTAHLLISEFK